MFSITNEFKLICLLEAPIEHYSRYKSSSVSTTRHIRSWSFLCCLVYNRACLFTGDQAKYTNHCEIIYIIYIIYTYIINTDLMGAM